MQNAIALQKINGFGPLLLAYLQGHPQLATAKTDTALIEQNIKARQNFGHRDLLYQTVLTQYNNLQVSYEVKQNIDRLKNNNSFCITTGHQLSLMGGPLFVTYKILTTVKLAQEYKKLFPACDFIPVFWIATEDHDKEEINHFYFRDEKFTWQTPQTGAVGRFSNEGIVSLIEHFRAQFPGLQNELLGIFEKAYSLNTLAQATRYLANALFGKYGVVVVDGDDDAFKKIFLPVAEKEITEKFVHREVSLRNKKLTGAGFEPSINPRELNLFLHTGHDRKRLEADNTGVHTADGSMKWGQDDFLNFIKENPGTISPNVLLRPVYQEMILPNLAYVGGPAEIEYWLQLDGVFEALNMAMPARILRICATVIGGAEVEKADRTGLETELFFGDEDQLIKHFLNRVASQSLDFSSEITALQQLFDELATKAKNVDPTLEPAVMAEKTRQEKALENIFGRIRKAEKTKHETDINRLKKLRSVFLPGGKLQERTWTLIDIPDKDRENFMQKALSLDLNIMNLLVL